MLNLRIESGDATVMARRCDACLNNCMRHMCYVRLCIYIPARCLHATLHPRTTFFPIPLRSIAAAQRKPLCHAGG